MPSFSIYCKKIRYYNEEKRGLIYMEKQTTKKLAPRYDNAFKEGAIKMVIEQKLSTLSFKYFRHCCKRYCPVNSLVLMS